MKSSGILPPSACSHARETSTLTCALPQGSCSADKLQIERAKQQAHTYAYWYQSAAGLRGWTHNKEDRASSTTLTFSSNGQAKQSNRAKRSSGASSRQDAAVVDKRKSSAPWLELIWPEITLKQPSASHPRRRTAKQAAAATSKTGRAHAVAHKACAKKRTR